MNLQQLLLFGLILCSVHLRAQDTLILHQELERFSTDDRKVQYLEERIKELYRSEPQAAIQYANLADSLLANMDTVAWRIELMIPKAIAYRAIGNNLRALNLLEQALSFINPSDTSLVLTKYRARIYYNQGIIERRGGNIPESISLGLMSLGILDSLLQYYPSDNRLCRIKASVLEGLGNTHGIARHYQESLTYFRQSLAIHLLLDSRNGIASALHNIGAVMYEIDDLDSAEYYFTQSIQYTDTVHRPNLLRNYYHNMAAIAVDRENWELAISFFRKSLQMYELNRNYDGMAHVHESMAYAYIQMKDYQKAKIEALIADSLVRDDLEAKVSIQDDLVNIYTAIGQPEKALHHHEQYILLKDSLISIEKDRAIAEMEAKYQHEQQEKELAIQQQEIELLNRSNQIQ
ncbi:MAG: tetratricopeptide repeat protein, partial [Bacteroidota bacterium]